MTFTKEQLIAAAHGRIDFANMMLSDNPEPLKERTWSIELELARIALSALRERAEPVVVPDLHKVVYHFRDLNEGFPVERFKADHVIAWMLANYPPAPVVPVHVFNEAYEQYLNGVLCGDNNKQAALSFLNACRAAMLKGNEA